MGMSIAGIIREWTHREVYMGYSIKDFNKTLDVLASNSIKYHFTVVDNAVGITRRDADKLYYVYVHKRDADHAKFLLGK